MILAGEETDSLVSTKIAWSALHAAGFVVIYQKFIVGSGRETGIQSNGG